MITLTVRRRVAALMLATASIGAASHPGPALAQSPSVGARRGVDQRTNVRIAVIGDYGANTNAERKVAQLVRDWAPDAVITLGDNNYPSGSASTIDANIGQYYADFIYPYTGQYTRSITAPAHNRFFPVLGNHDWQTQGAAPYLDYFTLPNAERYYTQTLGSVELFALDSDPAEPDGIGAQSAQATWLRAALEASSAPWRLVTLHHAPYSSGPHGAASALQWPYQAWGATAVLAGHDHLYERIMRDGFPYFVNGAGGAGLYSFVSLTPGSAVRFAAEHGAMFIEADSCRITFTFVTVSGTEIDRYQPESRCTFVPALMRSDHHRRIARQ